MSEILITPIKSMLDLAATAATELCNSNATSIPSFNKDFKFDITVTHHEDDDTVAVYIKNDGKVMYQKVVEISDFEDKFEAEQVVYGALMTELLSTYVIVSTAFAQVSQNIPTVSSIITDSTR